MGMERGIETHICGHYDLMGTSRHVACAASQVKLIYTAIKHRVMKNYQEQEPRTPHRIPVSFKIILTNIQEIRDWESVQRRTQSENTSQLCIVRLCMCWDSNWLVYQLG